MADEMSSRERMLAAISCRVPDHVPCSFMIFAALREHCKDQFEFVEKSLELGLDATMTLPVRASQRNRDTSEQADLYGLPVHFAPSVEVRDWREDKPTERYPILHREYVTPDGTLHTAVTKTEDWVQGDRVPLFDDFVIPRCLKPVVSGPEDLPALRHLLTPPRDEDIEELREGARRAKDVAARHDLLVVSEWAVLFDAACWLCGIKPLMLMPIDAPSLLEGLLDIINEWNHRRMTVLLEEGVDLLFSRAWYEHADFISPTAYRRFILPRLKKDVQLVHEAGAKFALITTTAYTPLLDSYLEAGIDVLVGLDPLQDARADFPLTKQQVGKRICLWGGVNGFVTVERGTPDEVRSAVREATEVLAPGGGFILSPVDNVTVESEKVWANVHALIDEWRKCRDY